MIKVIHFVPIDSSYGCRMAPPKAANSNFCFRMHRLATIHSLQTTDRRMKHYHTRDR